MTNRKPWTIEQVATLLVIYPRKGAAAVAREVGKSETSVRIKACRLDLPRLFHAESARGKRRLKPERAQHGP